MAKGVYLFSAERKKDAPGRGAQGRDCFGDRIHLDPLIAIRLLPSSTPERDERHAGKRGGADCVGRDLRGVRMGGIDQRADCLVAQVGCETFGTAEAAAAHRDGLRQGIGRAACQRQRDGEAFLAGQGAGKHAGFRGAAENEDLHGAG